MNGPTLRGAAPRRIEERYDVVVCGGGLAGLCAAVAAARHGASVCLVQDRPVLGGNSSSEIRVPPQGAASFHAYARETGVISELLIEERARNHEHPTFDNGYINSVWDLVQYDMAVTTPNLTLKLNTSITEVICSDRRKVADNEMKGTGDGREEAEGGREEADDELKGTGDGREEAEGGRKEAGDRREEAEGEQAKANGGREEAYYGRKVADDGMKGVDDGREEADYGWEEADYGEIEAVIASVHHAETELVLRARTFIDCTGDGLVAAMAGCEWRMGTESREEFGEPHAPDRESDAVMGNSIHFKAKDVGYPVPFVAPDWAVRYEDPDFFYKQGRWPGDPRSGFWWIELSVPWHTIHDNETLRHELTRHVLGVWDWIKNRDPRLKEEASTYALDWVGQVPGKRESRRIMGDYFMTEHDPLRKTVFPDEIAYGGWFIDLHEPGGLLAPYSEKAAVEGDSASYMAKSYVGPYGIPLRILIAKGKRNLMMAGRNVSVTHAALGTVRVMGTTALLGQAAGTAAAIAARAGIAAREVPARAIADVQQALLRDGCFLPNVAHADARDLARRAEARASSEAPLAGGDPPRDAGGTGAAPAEPLARRRAQWIAVGAARLERLAVCLSHEAAGPQTVEARLYAVEHIWDYRVEPGEPLAATFLQVEPGAAQWSSWPLGLDVSAQRGGYVRLDLLANPLVRWHAAETVEPGHVSAFELGNGQLRRFGAGAMMSFRVEPPQLSFGAANAISGVARPYRGPNLWRSDPALPLPQWLELTWEAPQDLGRVELTFGGHLLHDYRTYPGLYRAPECAKDVVVRAEIEGEWAEIGMLRDNYQPRRVLVFAGGPVRTARLRVTVLSTNGAPAAEIYEVRCYAE